MIYTDTPDYFADNAKAPYVLDVHRLIQFMLGSMSVDMQSIALDYTLRCFPAKTLPTTKAERSACIVECSRYRFATIAKVKPKALVALGQVSCEAFTGKSEVKLVTESPVRAWEGMVSQYVPHVWVGYSIAYALTSPSATLGIFRTLFQAAEEAGLNPKINTKQPVFHWPDIQN